MSELFDIKDKVALITGSSRGIDRAIAERMAEAGTEVVISSRKLDVCEEAAKGIRDKGGTAVPISRNITYREELQSLVDRTKEKLGTIGILVANAAVNQHFGPTQQIPDSAFDEVINCNIRSNHWLTQMVARDMAEQKDGVIISCRRWAGSKEACC